MTDEARWLAAARQEYGGLAADHGLTIVAADEAKIVVNTKLYGREAFISKTALKYARWPTMMFEQAVEICNESP